MTKSAKHFYDSAFGTAVHPWVNTPDIKFNTDGLFKLGLRLTGEDATAMKARVDSAAQEAFDDFMSGPDGEKLTPAERKKYSLYVPYEVEEDDNGNPTGAIVFDFKQNATIQIKATGEVKKIVIGIYDATGKPMKARVWGGSEVRVNYAMRPIPMKSLKQVGVRLDFGRIQVRKLSEGNGGSGGFGAVEGYAEDENAGGFGSASGDGQTSGSDTTTHGADY